MSRGCRDRWQISSNASCSLEEMVEASKDGQSLIFQVRLVAFRTWSSSPIDTLDGTSLALLEQGPSGVRKIAEKGQRSRVYRDHVHRRRGGTLQAHTRPAYQGYRRCTSPFCERPGRRRQEGEKGRRRGTGHLGVPRRQPRLGGHQFHQEAYETPHPGQRHPVLGGRRDCCRIWSRGDYPGQSSSSHERSVTNAHAQRLDSSPRSQITGLDS